MIVLVSGGSGSGKSEMAEHIAVRLSNSRNLIYIATMRPIGTETLEKIQRHRLMRCDKGFNTLEVYQDLHSVNLSSRSTILLECLSNLLANEMYSYYNPPDDVHSKIMNGIQHLSDISKNLVIVSNEIFSDCYYDKSFVKYIRNLGTLNCEIAQIADIVIESVYGNPVVYKGENLLYELV